MDKSQMNPLSYYNFIEEKSFEPHIYDVQISADDKIISVTEDGKLLGSVALDIEHNILSLIGKDGEKFSSAELPLVDVITDAYYDEERTSLVIIVKLSDGTDKEILVPFNDLLDDYAKKEEVDAVSGSLTSEIQDRTEKDEELSLQISEEIKNRENADNEINEKLDKKVEWTDISTEANPNRKSIVLGNHDTILGTTTDNNTYNLVMLSKWNKADLGSASVELNLNGSALHPTYNDSKELALLDDVVNLQNSVNISIQELKDVDNNLQEQINLLNGTEGNIAKELEELKAKDINLEELINSEISNRLEKDTELQSNIEAEATERSEQDSMLQGLIETEKARAEEAEKDLDAKILANTTAIAEESARAKSAEEANMVAISEEIKNRENADNEINEKLDKKVEWTDISTEANPNRKSIILNNHDTILGTAKDNNTYNLVMLSKWDKADFGSASVELNLNGSALHPTYNDEEEIAFISDITTSSENFSQEINDLKTALESEISTRSEKDTELQNNIVTESSERQTKDNELNEKIDNLHQNTEGELTSINDLINSIELVKDEDNDLIYHLMIGETNKGAINIPKDQFLNQVNYDPETNILTFIIEGAEAKSTVSVDLNDLVDTYFAGDGLVLNEKRTFAINIDPTSEEYLTLSTNGLKLSGLNEKFAQYTPSDSLNENFATKVELSQEVSRAKGEEAKLLGTEADSEEVMSLYGVKKYASLNQGEITNINLKIESIESNFDNYITKTDAVTLHDAVLEEAKAYTDTRIADEKLTTISEAVNQSKAYTNNKVSALSETIESNTNRITDVEGRCDHFDDLFSMILDEHGDPIELNFYTKSEIDTKVETLNNKDTELSEKLDKKVEWVDIATGDNPNRKSIVLENHDTILGKDTKGEASSLLMINKWDVVDLGTTKLPINLNTPSGVRPTVQEAGQTNEEANKIAYLSDIQNGIYSLGIDLHSTDDLLASKIAVLEEKLAKLSKTNVEEISLNEGSEVNFNDETKDYIIFGSETKSTTFVGKTVKLNNLTISNNARTNIKASDVELKGIQLSGEFPKTNGNSVININNAEYIVVKDMIFDSSNVYNGIEIGLSSDILPKSILFENCKFLGQFSNNAILIFGTQANAVININNCYFEDLSNPFRLSNNKNTSCTMNITNCKIDKWDINSPWQGMMLLQDYNSGDAEKANTNNLFAPEKITINVINTIGPNNKKITMPSDIATVCGTGDDKQLFYVWDNYRNLVPYDKSKYPTINIL